jgi:predicted MFS family arabinose efflux permease
VTADEQASTVIRNQDPGPSRPDRRRAVLVTAVALGFTIALASSAIKNTITAFLVPMAHSLGVSQGTFAIAPSVFMLVYAVASPTLGYIADRLGARVTLIGGLVGGGLLFLVGGSVSSFGWFTICYGVGMAIAFAALSYVPLGVFVDEVFPPNRRGLIYATLMNGTAAGFITLVPLWLALGGSVWRQVYVALAITMFVLALLAIVLLPRDRAASAAMRPGEAVPVDRRGAIAALLRSPVFWVVSIAFIGCGVTMGFVDVNLVPYMDMMGMSAPTVSTTIALLGAAEILGGLLAGYLCDRGYPLRVLAGCYLIRSLSLVILMLAPTALNASAFGLLFGFSYLGTVVASTMFIINLVDPRAKGLALGLMWLLHQVGAFASSEGGGLSYGSLRSYDPVVIGSAAIAAVSFLLSAVVLPRVLLARGASVA